MTPQGFDQFAFDEARTGELGAGIQSLAPGNLQESPLDGIPCLASDLDDNQVCRLLLLHRNL